MAEWFYLYCVGYQYALANPDDPDRWRFCDEALPAPASTAAELEARYAEEKVVV